MSKIANCFCSRSFQELTRAQVHRKILDNNESLAKDFVAFESVVQLLVNAGI